MKSIKTSLLIVMASFATTISLSFMVVAIVNSKSAIEKQVIRNLENTAASNAHVVDGVGSARMSFVQSIAEMDYIENENYSMEQKLVVMKERITENCGYNSVAYFLLDGTGVNTDGSVFDFSKEGYVDMVIESHKPEIVLYHHPYQKMDVYLYMAPVFNKKKDLIAVVIGSRPAVGLNNLLATSKIGKTGHVFILENKTGMYIGSGDLNIHPLYKDMHEDARNDSDLEDFVSLAEEVTARRESGTGSFDNGGKRLLAFSQCVFTDWTIMAYVPESEVMEDANKLQILFIGLACAFILGASLFGLSFASGVSNPIRLVTDLLKEIALGNLSDEGVDTAVKEKLLKRKDEIGQMSAAMAEMIQSLSSIVLNVRSGSSQIATASEELASGNQDLSKRTEQQASALEETSSAIEEMSASIKASNDNSAVATQLTNEAKERAQGGQDAINDVVKAMDDISDSSRQITEIIAVINNIAFQTNLLALNASIEAARAGEHGKGFAVVAVEVRKLAKNSQKASDEIAELIKNSTDRVADGVMLVQRAGESLSSIHEAVAKATEVVQEVAAASNEQLQSVEQIDSTLVNLDENTQKNAAMVEESASATEELSSQAEELNSSMDFFKLNASEKKPKLIEHPVEKAAVVAQKKVILKKDEPQVYQKGSIDSSYETFSSFADNGDFSEF